MEDVGHDALVVRVMWLQVCSCFVLYVKRRSCLSLKTELLCLDVDLRLQSEVTHKGN